MTKWDASKVACGNCQYWLLGLYQPDFDGAEPKGAGGPHTDGSVSDCRAKPPIHIQGGSAVWPPTKRDDWCGAFKAREGKT